MALSNEAHDLFKLNQFLIKRCKTDHTHMIAKNSVLQSGPIRKKEELNTAIKELCELDRIRIQRNGNSTVLKVNPALLAVANPKTSGAII